MYIVIMGAGRVGLSLANLLIENGHDITVIDNDETLCSDAASELDALVICGDGTSSKLLQAANIQDADFFVATTGQDESNLLSCVLVKQHGVPNIIARVSNPEHEEAFLEVGIDNVISPERTAAQYLEKVITKPNVADLVTKGEGDAEFLDFTITNKKIVGKQMMDVSPDKNFIIIATYEDGNLIIPQPTTRLEYSTKITVLVKRGNVKKVTKKFEG